MGLEDYGVWDGPSFASSLVLSLSLGPRKHHRIRRRRRPPHYCSLVTSKCFSKYTTTYLINVKHMLWNEVISSRQAGCYSGGGGFLGSGQEGLGMWCCGVVVIVDETADGKEGNFMDVIIGKRALTISVSEREISLMDPKGRLVQYWP